MPRKRRTPFVPEPPVYTFRIRMLESVYAPPNAREITREIEIAANHTLAQLATAIISAYDFDHDHLWSFYPSGKRGRKDISYTLDPQNDDPDDPILVDFPDLRLPPQEDAATTLMRAFPYPGKTGKQEFLFDYDFGDDWHFGVKLLRTRDMLEDGTVYPRVVASQGESPPQYPYSLGWFGDDDLVLEVHEPLRPSAMLLALEWSNVVTSEREQVEDLREFRDGDHYAPIAQFFADDPRRQGDEILDALLAIGGPEATWLDIGAGGGRYALALAAHGRRVTAVEPSAGMRAVLERSAQEHGVANVTVLPLRWPEGAEGVQVDVCLMAHVGYDITDINPFLNAAEAAARERCVCLLMERAPSSGFLRLFEQIHDEPRVLLPGLREFLHLLLARGALPEVRLFSRAPHAHSDDEIREAARRRLWLNEGSPKDRRLQQLLTAELAAGNDLDAFPTTIGLVSWRPAHAAATETAQ